MPDQWNKESKDKTLTLMKWRRSLENRPHPTFDLDGDGEVGVYDFALATWLDLDKDGILNSEEKKNALEMIKTGYMENFKWGLEASGTYRQRVW